MTSIFLPGKQTAVTRVISSFAIAFEGIPVPELFQNLHLKIYRVLRVLPYTDAIKQYEESRRWKLTATQVLEAGTIVDTKYCNDTVTVFVSVLRSLGIESYVAKVFREHPQYGLQVHSFVVVKTTDSRVYLVNTGDKNDFWYKRLKTDFAELKEGAKLPYEWILWKLDVDQWAMGLFDASQEVVIEEFARKYYQNNVHK